MKYDSCPKCGFEKQFWNAILERAVRATEILVSREAWRVFSNGRRPYSHQVLLEKEGSLSWSGQRRRPCPRVRHQSISNFSIAKQPVLNAPSISRKHVAYHAAIFLNISSSRMCPA